MQHPKAVLTVIGLTVGGTVAFYTFTTYMQKFLVNTSGFSKTRQHLFQVSPCCFYADAAAFWFIV